MIDLRKEFKMYGFYFFSRLWLTFFFQLCRFYHSLIKLGIVDPTSDAAATEMAHFSLHHSRYEDANALYRLLATSRL